MNATGSAQTLTALALFTDQLPGVIPLNPGIRLLSASAYTSDPGYAETLH